jgi:hypothetical protein
MRRFLKYMPYIITVGGDPLNMRIQKSQVNL